MNKIIVLGRLTRDPEVRYTPTQKVTCSFVLAVDRDFRNPETGEREADFIPVVVWGRTAELCGNSLAKGHRLLVEGRIQTRNFESKDGQKRYVTEIVANNVQFIERRPDAGGQPTQQPGQPTAPTAPATPPAAPAGQQPAYQPRQNGTYQKQAPAQQARYGAGAPRQGSYSAPQQGSYSAPQQGGYKRQAPADVPSPFDEEVPF